MGDSGRDEWDGRITPEEARQRERASALEKLEEIDREAVRPFEDAALTDCATGRAVVFAELTRLERLWWDATQGGGGANPYTAKMAAMAPRVRARARRP